MVEPSAETLYGIAIFRSLPPEDRKALARRCQGSLYTTGEQIIAYDDKGSLWDKINKLAKSIYSVGEVTAAANVQTKLKNSEDAGYRAFPICVAKTQYSFTADPAVPGAPSGFTLPVRGAYLSAAAEFMVALCGDIMTMPGLSKTPAADKIDIEEDGNIVGLF